MGEFSKSAPKKDEQPGPPLNHDAIVFGTAGESGTKSQKCKLPVRDPSGLEPRNVVEA